MPPAGKRRACAGNDLSLTAKSKHKIEEYYNHAGLTLGSTRFLSPNFEM